MASTRTSTPATAPYARPRPVQRQRALYAVVDFCSIAVAFMLFNVARCSVLHLAWRKEESYDAFDFLLSPIVLLETLLLPLAMVGLYWLTGFYAHVHVKSRVEVMGNTLLCAAIGALAFFFLALGDDMYPSRTHTLLVLGLLLGLLFAVPLAGRLIVQHESVCHIRAHRWQWPVAIVGCTPQSRALARRLTRLSPDLGYLVAAYIDPRHDHPRHFANLPVYPLTGLAAACREHGITHIVIGDTAEEPLMPLVHRLTGQHLPVLVHADRLAQLTVQPRITNVVDEPLVDITAPSLSPGMLNVKRVIDVVVSALALLLASPVMGAIAVAVRRDSPGPVFYSQWRVGHRRKPFRIYKFRSMRVDAEAAGPRLSSHSDSRVTAVGRFLRKYRLDELPNLWNVLRGDMSLVGPRPEREYYLRQLLERAPEYALLHSVRPGVTSWGMVRYGYAGNVDQMLERMRYDLLYVGNMSLAVDIKILFHTFNTIITGRGV